MEKERPRHTVMYGVQWPKQDGKGHSEHSPMRLSEANLVFVWVGPFLCVPVLSLGSHRGHSWVQHVMMNVALGWQHSGNRRVCPVHTTLYFDSQRPLQYLCSHC